MKITPKALKRLIQEELDAVLTEVEVGQYAWDEIIDWPEYIRELEDACREDDEEGDKDACEKLKHLKPFRQIKDNLLGTAEDIKGFGQAFEFLKIFHKPGQRMGREFTKWLFDGVHRKLLDLRRKARRNQENYDDDNWGNLMDNLFALKRRIRTGIVDSPQV